MTKEALAREKAIQAWKLISEIIQLLPKEYGGLHFVKDGSEGPIGNSQEENREIAVPFPSVPPVLPKDTVKGGILATPEKENQMKIMIDVPGVSINATPRKDGRYQGYATRDGKKFYFYGRTTEEVVAKIAKFVEEDKKEKFKSARKTPTVSFGKFVEKWIELYKKPKLKPLSLQNLHNDVKPALQRFSETRIDKITGDDLQIMFNGIQSGRLRELCFTYLNSIFEKACIQNVIKRNPCLGIELKSYKKKKIKGLTPDMQEIFLEAIKDHKYSLVFRLILSSGMRIGEILALEKADLISETYSVRIDKDVVFIKGKRIVQPPKTDSAVRTIPLPIEIFKELQSVRSSPLFPYTYNSINHAMQRIAKITGIEVSAHMLRHTYTDRLEEAGVPPKVKQFLLGHAKLDTTQNVYTDTQEHYVKRFDEAIRNAIFPPKNEV